MEKDRKFRALAIAAICIAVVGVSVAYAALAASLTITGTATLETANSWEVKFVSPSSMTNPANLTADGPELDGERLVRWSTTFTAPGQYIAFTVDVENAGSIDAVLNNITKTVEGAAKTVKVEGTDYEVFTYETKIGSTVVEKVGDLAGTGLASGEKFTVSVKVTFDAAKKLDEATLEALSGKTVDFTFGMDFGQASGTETAIPA